MSKKISGSSAPYRHSPRKDPEAAALNKKQGIKRHPKALAAPVENNGTKVAIGPVNYSATGSGSARNLPHGYHQHQITNEATYDQRHSQ